MNYKVLMSRVLVILAGAIWLGGLTFYASVVIPMAHGVLGSHTTVGFITRQVTGWINIIGVVALMVFLANLVTTRVAHKPRLRLPLAGAWGVMALVQVVLFFLHPRLDRLLDAEAMTILDPEGFYPLHQIYLAGTTVQLIAGLAFLTCVLAVWHRQDMLAAGHSGIWTP